MLVGMSEARKVLNKGGLDRRGFLGAVATAGSLLLSSRPSRAASEIPRRTLGRTGESVPILGLGAACFGQCRTVSADEVTAICHEALEQGIDFFDVARAYGKAEEVIGRFLEGRRDQVFLTTKAGGTRAGQLGKSFEESLRLLRTDHVDLLYWHGMGGKNLDVAAEADGAFAWLEDQKRKGRARFVGFTSHSHPSAVARAIESGVADVVMVPFNPVDRHIYGFEEKLLPKARARGVGVLAMKVFGGPTGDEWSRYVEPDPGPQIGVERLEMAFRYAVSLPGVAGAVIGVHTKKQLREVAALARGFVPFDAAGLDQVVEAGQRIAPGWNARFGPTT